MATPITNSLTDHSPLDNTGAKITGTLADENGFTLSAILDGTTAVELNTAASPLLQLNNPIVANTAVAARQ